MESQQPERDSGGGDADHVTNDEPGLPLENYEFTFDLARLPGSGNMSFIEPEVGEPQLQRPCAEMCADTMASCPRQPWTT